MKLSSKIKIKFDVPSMRKLQVPIQKENKHIQTEIYDK